MTTRPPPTAGCDECGQRVCECPMARRVSPPNAGAPAAAADEPERCCLLRPGHDGTCSWTIADPSKPFELPAPSPGLEAGIRQHVAAQGVLYPAQARVILDALDEARRKLAEAEASEKRWWVEAHESLESRHLKLIVERDKAREQLAAAEARALPVAVLERVREAFDLLNRETGRDSALVDQAADLLESALAKAREAGGERGV